MSIYDKSSLVLIPSGTKTGKIFSQKPVSGDGDFTFTRASAATRVNADGNIEKETQNKLLYSNQPNQWSVVSVSLTSGQAGYDGSNDAWLFDSSAGYISNGLSLSGVYTYSIYAKKGTADGIRLRMDAGTDANVYINLTDGSEFFSNTGIDYSATSVGGGWWRISITANDSSFSNFRVYAIDAGGSTTGTIYIQDAQVNQGLVAQPYQETTTAAVYGGITDNTPRLDYTDSSCPALLLEPQRTNTIPYSEYQSGGGFTLGSNITWNGFVESPEGVNNASRFTSNVQGFSYVAPQGVVIPSGDFTFSMWVRGVSGTFLNRPLNIAGLSGTSLVYMNETPVAGEDWKLVYGTGNNTGSAVTKTITLPFYDQPVNSVLDIYGFQLEAGSYATSYIPTYGSSVSRVGETCTDAGTAATFNSTEGVLYLEIEALSDDSTNRWISISQDSDINANQLNFRYAAASNLIQVVSRANGLGQDVVLQHTLSDETSFNKIAVKYKLNDWALWVNGVEVDTETSSTAFTANSLDVLDFHRGNQSNFFYGKTKQILVFTTALSDAELATLTTI